MSETATVENVVSSNVNSTSKLLGGVTGKGFQPGKSGNPKGRTKGAAELAKTLREFFAQDDPKEKNKTRLAVLIEDMIKSDPKTLLAYAYGKPQENINLSGDIGISDARPLEQIPSDRLRQLATFLPASVRNGNGNGN